MTTKKPTGFDSFFAAMSSTPEYKEVMSGMQNISKMEKELREIDSKSKKIGELNSALKNTFDTEEAREAGKNASIKTEKKPEKQTGDASREDEGGNIDITYFTNDEPATWGFSGVAGMKNLKDELRENFINPLQFKFFVEKLLQEEEKNEENSDGEDSKNKTGKNESIYKDLYQAYKEFKVGIPTGMLFYGPPGTGKTYITKKLAQELGAGFIMKSVGEFGSSYIHQTSKNIHNFFKQAKTASNKGPIILFLDEIDSLVSKRGGNADASKAEEVSQFLQEFNNLDDAPNLVIVAATNRPDNLDSAILRSGRFDKKIYIGEPDYTARKELFEIFIEKKKRPHTKLDYRELAMLTEGYVASDIEAIVEEASRDASQGILDLVKLVQKGKHNPEKIKEQLEKHTISMELLKQAIIDTTPSLKMVDMKIYTDWIEKLEK